MTNLRERIAARVAIEDRGHVTCCHVWQGPLDRGYGEISVSGRMVGVHKAAYELARGPVPQGLVLDHLCRVRSCVNPDHLEPVTNRENVRRGIGPRVAAARMLGKTHCPHGHAYTSDNLIKRSNGWRQCRECNRIACAKRRSGGATSSPDAPLAERKPRQKVA